MILKRKGLHGNCSICTKHGRLHMAVTREPEGEPIASIGKLVCERCIEDCGEEEVISLAKQDTPVTLFHLEAYGLIPFFKGRIERIEE